MSFDLKDVGTTYRDDFDTAHMVDFPDLDKAIGSHPRSSEFDIWSRDYVRRLP